MTWSRHSGVTATLSGYSEPASSSSASRVRRWDRTWAQARRKTSSPRAPRSRARSTIVCKISMSSRRSSRSSERRMRRSTRCQLLPNVRGYQCAGIRRRDATQQAPVACRPHPPDLYAAPQPLRGPEGAEPFERAEAGARPREIGPPSHDRATSIRTGRSDSSGWLAFGRAPCVRRSRRGGRFLGRDPSDNAAATLRAQPGLAALRFSFQMTQTCHPANATLPVASTRWGELRGPPRGSSPTNGAALL